MAVAPARTQRLAPFFEAWNDGVEVLVTRIGPLLDLFIRFWLAQIFFRSGVLKTATWATTVFLYTAEHPVPGVAPETAAVIGTAVELVCPVLLVVGLMSRLAALPLLLTTAFLQLTYKELDVHLYWMLLFGLIVVRGPGALSLDALIAPHLRGSAIPFGATWQRIGRFLSRRIAPLYLLALRLWLARALVVVAVPEIAAQAPISIALRADDALVAACALMFAFGLLTRLTALPLLVVAIGLYWSEPDHDAALLQALLVSVFVLHGGGAFAVDRLLAPVLARLIPSLTGGNAQWLEGAPRVVIVGAGFGGIATALGLRRAWARVTIIDRRNYYLFQPLLYQVATANLSPADIATPIRSVLRGQQNCQVIMGRVSAVDTEARHVVIGDRILPYDYLVLATGARHSYFGNDQWEAHAPGLKKIDDATAMRGRILWAFEQAETCEDPEERRRLLTFVIVGGGPTGVELAGAIAELARHGMLDEFRAVDPALARVILVQSGPRVLPAMAETLSARARGSLQRLGVDVMLNSRVEQVDSDGVVVSGRRINARTVLWAAGVMASAAGRWIGARRDNSGRIIVNPDLSVPCCGGVFAIGDTAACPGPEGRALPGLAAVAKQQGQFVAKLIRAHIEGRRQHRRFRYADFGSMATIGRKAAVADLRGLKLSGGPAWWLWGIVHVAFLVDGRSRMAVLLEWFWSYLTYSRRMRLITGAEAGAD